MNIRAGLLCFCFSLICFKGVSQHPVNGVQHNERTSIAPDDTNKVLLYISLTDSFVLKNSPAEALIVVQKAQSLSNKLNYTHGLIFSFLRFGYLQEVIKKNYTSAIGYYKQAIEVAEKRGTYTDINTGYGCILNMYYYIGDYPSAMVIAQKGLARAEQRRDKENIAHYNNQFGFIYLKQEKPALAIKYYGQYLQLALEIGDQPTIADADICMADVYLMEKDYKTSLHYLFNAFDLYKKLELARSKSFENKRDRIAYTLYKISRTHKLQGNYKLSLKYALDGLNYNDGRHIPSYNPYDLASYYINAGEIYMELKDYGHAMSFLSKGLALSKTILHREDILEAYSALSKTYALQKSFDNAYHFQQLYSALKDSLINDKTSRAIEQIRSSFENDKKDKEIALLNQQQKLKEIESEKKMLTLNIIIIFVTLFAVISYLILYIRNNKRQQKLAHEKQVAIQNERLRISSDMHDDVGTGLSTMLIYVNMLKSKLKGTVDYTDIDRVARLGNDLVAQMKEIVWSLNPGNDSLESLLVFIRQYFSLLFEPLLYRTNLVFPATIPNVELKGVIRRNIYLCIKEALNNVTRHSNADTVELSIQLQAGKLVISVKDNGIGFPDKSDSKFFSNGLKNMQRRMEQIGGKFHFLNDGGAFILIELILPGYPNG